MNERIREYVKGLLQNAPQTRRIEELREELIAGCMDKYEDLTASGTPEEEAYRAVVSGIGDVDELVRELSSSTLVDEIKATMTESGKQAKLRSAISSSMWSLILILYISASFMTNRWGITWMIFVFGACLQTVISMLFAPQGSKMRSFSGVLWTGTVFLYLFVSFTTWKWSITWIIFLMAVALQQVIRLVRLWRD